MHVCLPPSYLRFTKLNGKDPTRKDISQLSSAEEAGKVADFFLAWNKANRGGNIASGGKAHVVTSKPSHLLKTSLKKDRRAAKGNCKKEKEVKVAGALEAYNTAVRSFHGVALYFSVMSSL